MKQSLDFKITIPKILSFTTPTIVMMLFMSFYTMVDGIFVSNYVSTDALSAVNIVFPMMNLIMAVGIMFATGASAIIANYMGEKKYDQARKCFSQITYVCLIIGVVLTVLLLIFIRPILYMLGADASIFQYCYE